MLKTEIKEQMDKSWYIRQLLKGEQEHIKDVVEIYEKVDKMYRTYIDFLLAELAEERMKRNKV